jgi:hypothetical protein
MQQPDESPSSWFFNVNCTVWEDSLSTQFSPLGSPGGRREGMVEALRMKMLPTFYTSL